MNGASGAGDDGTFGCIPGINRSCMPASGSYSKQLLSTLYESARELKQDLKENLGLDFGDDGVGSFRLNQQPPKLPPSYVQAQRANAGIYAGQTGFTPPPSRPASVLSQASNVSFLSNPPLHPRRPASVRGGPSGPGPRPGDPSAARYAYSSSHRGAQQSAFSQWGPPVIAFLGILACLVLKLRGSMAGAGGAAPATGGGFASYLDPRAVGAWGASVGSRLGSARDGVFGLFRGGKAAPSPAPPSGGKGGAGAGSAAFSAEESGAGKGSAQGQQQQQQQQWQQQNAQYREAGEASAFGGGYGGAQGQQQQQQGGAGYGAGYGGFPEGGLSPEDAQKARRAQQWRAAQCGTPQAERAVCNALLSMGHASQSAHSAEQSRDRLNSGPGAAAKAAAAQAGGAANFAARGLPSMSSPATSPALKKRARLWRASGCGGAGANRRVCATLLSLDEATLRSLDLASLVESARSGATGFALPPAGPQADAAMCAQALTASEARATELVAMQEHLDGVLESLTTVRAACLAVEAQLAVAAPGPQRSSLAGQLAACHRTMAEHDGQALDGTARLEALAEEAEAVARHAELVCEAAAERQAASAAKAAEKASWLSSQAADLERHAEELARGGGAGREPSEGEAWRALREGLEREGGEEGDGAEDSALEGGGVGDADDFDSDFDTPDAQAARARAAAERAKRGKKKGGAAARSGEEEERKQAEAAGAAAEQRRAAIAAEYERAARAQEERQQRRPGGARKRRRSLLRTAVLSALLLTVPLTGVALLSARAAERLRFGAAAAGVPGASEPAWVHLQGQPSVGGTLLAVVRLEMAAEFVFTWSRLRAGSAEADVIDGANAPWYQCAPEDAGCRVVVTVTSVLADGNYGPTSSAMSAAVAAAGK